MDVRRALERKRNGGGSSTRQQNRVHPVSVEEDDDGIEMLRTGAAASDEVDVDWIDEDNVHVGGRTSTPSPEDRVRFGGGTVSQITRCPLRRASESLRAVRAGQGTEVRPRGFGGTGDSEGAPHA